MFCFRTSALRPVPRGFTTVELLVVLAIVGLLIAIGGTEAIKFIRRQRPVAASQDLQLFAKRVFLESQRRGVDGFLRIAPPTAPPHPTSIPIEIWVDTDNDRAFNAANDALIDTYRIPLTDASGANIQQLSLSTLFKNQVQSAAWSFNGTAIGTERLLGCDSVGRAYDPTNRLQIGAVATLNLTHVDMISSSLLPRRNHQLRISPAWNVQVVPVAY